MRSETLRTRTPGSASSASVISRPWPSFRALQLMSTTSVAVCDSTTSNAVTTPPTCPIATVRSPAALAEAGTSTRAVMAYPGPGTGTAGPYRRPAQSLGPARSGAFGACGAGPHGCVIAGTRSGAEVVVHDGQSRQGRVAHGSGSRGDRTDGARPRPDPQRRPRRTLGGGEDHARRGPPGTHRHDSPGRHRRRRRHRVRSRSRSRPPAALGRAGRRSPHARHAGRHRHEDQSHRHPRLRRLRR